MPKSLALPVESLERHAQMLLDLLVDCGPMTSAECREKLHWSRGRFAAALRYARTELCPDMDLAVPHPTPQTGWRYQVTDEWQPVEEGASFSLGQVETRLASIHRDVLTIEPRLERGSKEWRRANFLKKHLDHITRTLREINDGEG